MKQIIAIVSALILSFQPACASVNPPSKIVWQEYSSSIFEQAKSTHRPVILLSKEHGCYWCEQFESTTLSNPTVIKLINQSYTPVVIEMNKNRDIFIQYKIIKLPTTIIFDTNGKAIKIATGCIKPDRMIQILKTQAKSNIIKS